MERGREMDCELEESVNCLGEMIKQIRPSFPTFDEFKKKQGAGCQKFCFRWLRGRSRRLLLDARIEIRSEGGELCWEETKVGWLRSHFDVVVSGPMPVVIAAVETFGRFFDEVNSED